MKDTFNEIVMQTFGYEFGLQSELFQQFVYFLFENKLKNSVQLCLKDGKTKLTITNVPDEEIGLLINDLAIVTKPDLIVFEPKPSTKRTDSSTSYRTKKARSKNNYKIFDKLDIEICATIGSRASLENDYMTNIGLEPIKDDCPYRGNYNVYDRIEPEQPESSYMLLLYYSIKYNMNFIIDYIIEDKTQFISDRILELVVEKHDLKLFKRCLQFVKTIKPNTLLKAIKEEQIDIICEIIKTGIAISTECIKAICNMDKALKILAIVNLYGNVSCVDYNDILSAVNDIDIIKLFIHQHIDHETIVNKAIFNNDFELFTTFIGRVDDVTNILEKCTRYNRLDMIQHLYNNYDTDDVFNQIFSQSVKFGKRNIIKWIITNDNPIYLQTWNDIETKLENVCDKDILPHILDRFKTTNKDILDNSIYKLLLNAVCKNDIWSVEYITNNCFDTLYIPSLNDIIFKQAVFHNNLEMMQNLLKLNRVFQDDLTELLELVKNPEMEKLIKDNV